MSKTILLTGASRGIGLAIAHHLLSHPAKHNLVAIARNPAPLQSLASQYPSRVTVLPADLADFSSVAPRAVTLALDTYRRLDGLILNHGALDPVTSVADASAEAWRRAFDVNFFAAVALVQAALPALRESQGTVLFTSSGAAVSSYVGWGAYGSAKAAMNHFAATVGREEPEVVSIAVRPGVVDTEMQREIREKHSAAMDGKEAERFRELKESGALLRPEQPGRVMAELVLDAPKELSGRFLAWNAEELKRFHE